MKLLGGGRMTVRLMGTSGIAAIPITALDPPLVRLLLRSRRLWIPVSYIGAQGLKPSCPLQNAETLYGACLGSSELTPMMR